MQTNFQSIAYVASSSEKAQNTAKILASSGFAYKLESKTKKPELVLVLGGDGFLIGAAHRFLGSSTKIYGINCGNFGFLLNKFDKDSLIKDISESICCKLPFIEADLFFEDGSKKTCFALNDIQVIRCTPKAINLEVFVDNIKILPNLAGDGLLIATACGSTAYNFSAGGPVLPIGCNMVALTAVNSFLPKNFKSKIISTESKIAITAKDIKRRPISVVADLKDFYGVQKIVIKGKTTKFANLLFKKDCTLEEKNLKY